jgi:hypothetical protein
MPRTVCGLCRFLLPLRFAKRSDRAAFADVAIEQLAELMGQPLPTYVGATRSLHVRRLLAEAAEACRQCGERLVLVVDGLDEDRSAGDGGGLADSIAAMLPKTPAAGMKVIVSGRLNPPVSVGFGHPLSDPHIAHELSRSREAGVIRDAAEHELRFLLNRDPEHQLIGFLVAAGGGLSLADLADLTGNRQFVVAEKLSGRTFQSRITPLGNNQATQEVYILAHEDLQKIAAELLHKDLDHYRQQLHDCADTYHLRSGPAETPRYLLCGYFRMLHEIKDQRRMVAYATDKVGCPERPGQAVNDRGAWRNYIAPRFGRRPVVFGPSRRASARRTIRSPRVTVRRDSRLMPCLPPGRVERDVNQIFRPSVGYGRKAGSSGDQGRAEGALGCLLDPRGSLGLKVGRVGVMT